jgi:cell division protein FtsQ
MAGGRTGRGSRRRTRAASVVVPFPQSAVGDRLDLARLAPSGRFLTVVAALVAGVLAAYWGARESSVFAVEKIEIVGAPPALSKQVRAATSGALGRSLLELDATTLAATVRSLPMVSGASVDRAFPNTLVVRVLPERPVAVIRRGASAWLATGSGNVIREIEPGTQRWFPRLWLTREVTVELGRRLPDELATATRALAAARAVKLPRAVQAVRSKEGQLTLVLRGGPELRLGAARDLVLKLAVSARVLPLLEEGTLYLDVSVPARPVSSTYPAD